MTKKFWAALFALNALSTVVAGFAYDLLGGIFAIAMMLFCIQQLAPEE